MSGTNFERNKKQQEYIAPLQRPSCLNCKHYLVSASANSWQCSKGGFYVKPYATCKDHKSTSETPKATS